MVRFILVFMGLLIVASQSVADKNFEKAYALIMKKEPNKADLDEGICILRALVAQNDADAQNFLGWLHEIGRGVLENLPEAGRLYQLAARQQNADGQYNWATFMDNYWEHTEENTREVTRMYHLAAAQNHTGALARIGSFYAHRHLIRLNDEGLPLQEPLRTTIYRYYCPEGSAMFGVRPITSIVRCDL